MLTVSRSPVETGTAQDGKLCAYSLPLQGTRTRHPRWIEHHKSDQESSSLASSSLGKQACGIIRDRLDSLGMGDSGNGIALDGTTITTGLTGSSYDGQGSPSVGFIIGMAFWNICATGGLIGVLRELFSTIFEASPFFKSRSQIVFLSIFAMVWAGISSIPGILLIAPTSHISGFILGLVNLSCSGVPVLVFLLAVIVKKALMLMAAITKSRIQGARNQTAVISLQNPPASVPNAVANC